MDQGTGGPGVVVVPAAVIPLPACSIDLAAHSLPLGAAGPSASGRPLSIPTVHVRHARTCAACWGPIAAGAEAVSFRASIRGRSQRTWMHPGCAADPLARLYLRVSA